MTALHPSLTEAFPPPFAHFGETLGPPCADAVPLPELLSPATLPGRAVQVAGGDRRAALSFWSQHYLLALIPCAVAAALALRRDLPLEPGAMAAVLTAAGHPCRLCVPHGGGDTAQSCPVRRLAPLLRVHLSPLEGALDTAGLSPLVFWSNAASVLAWTLRVVNAPEADRAAIWAAMSQPDWADGGPNPFRRVVGSDPAQRRICCLRFRLPCVARCPDCPGTQACASKM